MKEPIKITYDIDLTKVKRKLKELKKLLKEIKKEIGLINVIEK